MILGLAFCFFFSYVPFFQNTFLTRGVPVEHIFIPFVVSRRFDLRARSNDATDLHLMSLQFAIYIVLLDEGRKYCVRTYPKGILAKIAW